MWEAEHLPPTAMLTPPLLPSQKAFWETYPYNGRGGSSGESWTWPLPPYPLATLCLGGNWFPLPLHSTQAPYLLLHPFLPPQTRPVWMWLAWWLH